jgi:AraC-like DNA-binding protein
MLATTGLSILEIATTVGFADQSHFIKAFRRSVGATQKRWRHDRQGQTRVRRPLRRFTMIHGSTLQ